MCVGSRKNQFSANMLAIDAGRAYAKAPHQRDEDDREHVEHPEAEDGGDRPEREDRAGHDRDGGDGAERRDEMAADHDRKATPCGSGVSPSGRR